VAHGKSDGARKFLPFRRPRNYTLTTASAYTIESSAYNIESSAYTIRRRTNTAHRFPLHTSTRRKRYVTE
jgi:hypothetical protein